MSEPTGWFKNNEKGSYSVFYVNPFEHGVSLNDKKDYIPLYDDWQDRLKTIQDSLQKGESIRCNEDGTFEAIPIPGYIDPDDIPEPPPEPKTDIERIADAIRDGINSV